ncbi:MAG: NADH-quinone oxidoreductase subunit K [Omnitrophica bacterium RIFCSPHIGHO2_02_FULL_46_11]|nr:MAG: NADH-quinone oxidoreductase subunit K [Omnitrophica bacterium RIFCSPLOWO2_01_FULL_45_10b]OGW87851.1 MAG: NADH-quinone oxidoreductase subunit K [Omnitrophica bacterium RIFCSPHIGHO2_02_FULL_46_11]
MIPLTHYLIVSGILFAIGALGVLMRRNIIIMLLSIEIMLNAANLSFVAFSSSHADFGGQIFSLFVVAVAASEVAIGLAIAVLFFRSRGILDPNEMNLMKD